MNKQRIIILIAAGIGAISTFLPWREVIGISVNGTAGGDGWVTLVLFGLVILTALTGKKEEILGWIHSIFIFIMSLIAAIVGAFDLASLNSTIDNLGSDSNIFTQGVASTAQVGIGLYLVLFAGIVVAITAVVRSPFEAKKKSSEKKKAE
jgi:hypothetical protein